jgi:ABC-type polysaccharide/polyol phosphate transport system ATPase subunit
MSDDVLVKVDNVSKRFCRSLKRSLWYGLQDLGSEIGGRRHGGGSGLPQSSADVQLRPDEFWAVKDVSFELRRGECLGLIGRNGAGKTTLLRMLNGLIKPDAGRIQIRGTAGALIALGAGFNPLLTGRENIYVNASILGLSKSAIDERIDEIIDFAEIGSFIDSPVQSYSSGMQVRLGFATATKAIKPDILILDEVLAVGDEGFRSKCFLEITRLLQSSAVVFVSHNQADIARISSSVLYLVDGENSFCGYPAEALETYHKKITIKSIPASQTFCANGVHVSLVRSPASIEYGSDLFFDLVVSVQSELRGSLMVGILKDSQLAAQAIVEASFSGGAKTHSVVVKDLRLCPGMYAVNINFLSPTGAHLARIINAFTFINVGSPLFSDAHYAPKITCT